MDLSLPSRVYFYFIRHDRFHFVNIQNSHKIFTRNDFRFFIGGHYEAEIPNFDSPPNTSGELEKIKVQIPIEEIMALPVSMNIRSGIIIGGVLFVLFIWWGLPVIGLFLFIWFMWIRIHMCRLDAARAKDFNESE